VKLFSASAGMEKVAVNFVPAGACERLDVTDVAATLSNNQRLACLGVLATASRARVSVAHEAAKRSIRRGRRANLSLAR